MTHYHVIVTYRDDRREHFICINPPYLGKFIELHLVDGRRKFISDETVQAVEYEPKLFMETVQTEPHEKSHGTK